MLRGVVELDKVGWVGGERGAGNSQFASLLFHLMYDVKRKTLAMTVNPPKQKTKLNPNFCNQDICLNCQMMVSGKIKSMVSVAILNPALARYSAGWLIRCLTGIEWSKTACTGSVPKRSAKKVPML